MAQTDQDDDESLPVVPGFGRSAAAAWWSSASIMGGARGGVGPGVDDVLPGLGHGEELVVAVVVMRFCGFGGGGVVSCSGGRQRRQSSTTPVSGNLRN